MEWCSVIAVMLVLSEPEYPWYEDIHRFPSKEACCAALEFNRAYRSNIELKQAYYPSHHWYYHDILSETDYCHNCWNVLSAACGGDGDEIPGRRRYLKRLKELIGTEAYLAGRMPPCVPVWRFNNRGIR